MTIPAGLDLVEHLPTTVVLQAQHHNHQKYRRYAVASRGEQCVLLALDFTATNQQFPTDLAQSNDWQEIAWFEGNPDSIYNLVSISYRDWLTSKMKELAAEILNN